MLKNNLSINHVKIVMPNEVITGSIEITDGKITKIQKEPLPDGQTWQGILMPGFIDTHIHGGFGYDVMDAKESAINGIATGLLKEGTTGFLATTTTQSIEVIKDALSCIARYDAFFPKKGAILHGIHLEGPFISNTYKGAQNPNYIIKPSVLTFKQFEKASNDMIKKVTLAPECDTNFDLIHYLSKKGIIISIGHSDATYELGELAIDAGASSMTHFYNAMRNLHHRDAGLVGLGLVKKELDTEIILDGFHVSKPALNLLFQTKSNNHIILITDSIRAKGQPKGTYELGGQQVIVTDKARLIDKTIAGSILKMNEACRYAKDELGISLSDISKIASLNPARTIGIDDYKGSIEVGKDADFVLLDEAFNVMKTIINGQILYEK